MLSLINRELHDHSVYVVTPCIVSLMMIGITIMTFLWGVGNLAPALGYGLAVAGFLCFSILGSAQMYTDRSNRVSALLSTLRATRSQIFLSRVIVGALTVLAALAPAIVTSVVLLKTFVTPFEFYSQMVVEISITTILGGFLCYCAGLQVGWTTDKTWLVLGTLLLPVLCASLIAIKGFGPPAMLILVLLIVALLARTWSRFVTTSL